MSAPPADAIARDARDARDAHVACVGCDAPTVALVREALAVGLPGVRVEEEHGASLGKAPAADCVVLQAAPGLELALRTLRASGYGGAVAVIVDDDTDGGGAGGGTAAVTRFGVQAVVPRPLVARELPAAVAGVFASTVDASGRPHPAWAALRRVEHLVAAGEVALGLRHALNNSLAGLLAEAQLLEMERLPAEQQEAVRRIVALCRRTIAVTRELDAIAAPRRGDAVTGRDAGAA